MPRILPLLALLLAGTATAAPQAPPAAGAGPASAVKPDRAGTQAEDARLLAFLDAAFDEAAARSPETLTGLGIKTGYDRLDDYTDAEAERQRALAEAKLAEMKAKFDPARLSPAAQLSYRLFEYSVVQGREQYKWRDYGFPFSTNGSPAGDIPVFLINQHRIDTVADADAYVARLRDSERVMREISDRALRQAEKGIVPPKFNFAPVRADAKRVITGAPFDQGADSTLLADFRKKVAALDAPAETKTRLIAEANAALSGPFRRGIDTMLKTLDAIEPKATGNQGAWSLPEGADYYTARLRASTTTDLSADRIHQIGLSEVARIHKEMSAIKDRVGFKGDLKAFFQHIKNGSEFKYPNTEAGRQAYLANAKGLIAQVMAKAPTLFRRLPKAPLEVRAVETWRQETASVAFYNPPTPDGSRPGIYYVNLADMNQVLKPQIESISYHEGAPGHHFQIALQQELTGIPKFRRFGFYGAYVEGWGLYAERLGREMGFYQDPYSEFGHLSLELWRAVRLVTDTGIHSKRWTREQAIRYFQENSLLSERDIVKEVERYFNWPGQATSYKIGQLKIVELRQRAERELGPKFDVRDFHAAVLENGALPLDILDQQVAAYIAAKKQEG
ncbi:DUF885 family protein [Sphingosinicella sp. BN140058]|uniref:DUF885 domain-containing protein n=1 Tax=Sphingosinicella sp. BN140058 TaxID=1892855 RepID=UPI001010D62D|nr:DUF885 domain-containing protein [Sphingosinicella sp. BN140058]QAY78568.1 DUF885 domain-containing protein [Sphingosinicella sp. BN140058]